MTADSGHPRRRASDMPSSPVIHRSENRDVAELVADRPHILLERGQVLFAEGDPPSCMYVVKTGALQIRSGSVVYEDVGPGGIVGEMGLIERRQPRTATVYAMTDSELVEIDEARFAELIARDPTFAIAVMRTLSRRLRVMDRRYRPSP